jgi:hypothetical protein
VKQIHTHKGPSDKSLFLHKGLPVKSTPLSPSLFRQENAAKKYQFSNYSGNIYHLCVPPFHFSIIWSSEMHFLVIYLETWGGTQPYFAFSILEFRFCFFVFGGTHRAVNSFSLHNQYLTLWLWFKRLACGMLLVWHRADRTVELNIDIIMNLKLKTVTKSLQQSEGRLPVVLYCTHQSSERLYAFLTSPTDCIWNLWRQHHDKPALPRNLNIIRLKPKQCMRKHDDMYS